MEDKSGSNKVYIEGYGEIITQKINGINFETLGSRVANMVAAIVHPEQTKQKFRVKMKEIPKFLSTFEKVISVSEFSIEQKETLRKNVNDILQDYPGLLRKAIAEDPETKLTIEKEISPYIIKMRKEASEKAQERADKGEDFWKAYEAEIEKTYGSMVDTILNKLYLGE